MLFVDSFTLNFALTKTKKMRFYFQPNNDIKIIISIAKR